MLIDMRMNRDKYPTLRLKDDDFVWTQPKETAEVNVGASLIARRIGNTSLTLAEDRRIRELALTLANTNQDPQDPRVRLPNNLAMEFEPAADTPLRVERMTFFMMEPKGPRPRP
jgi:hypothetical protein